MSRMSLLLIGADEANAKITDAAWEAWRADLPTRRLAGWLDESCKSREAKLTDLRQRLADLALTGGEEFERTRRDIIRVEAEITAFTHVCLAIENAQQPRDIATAIGE